MKDYFVKEDEMKFLKNKIKNFTLINKVTTTKDKYSYKVQLTDDEAMELVEELMTSFMEIGLDTNDEPTALGIYIETLASKFNPVLHSANYN